MVNGLYEETKLTVRFFTHSQSTTPYETRTVGYGTIIADPPTSNAPTGWTYHTYMQMDSGITIDKYTVTKDTDFYGIWKYEWKPDTFKLVGNDTVVEGDPKSSVVVTSDRLPPTVLEKPTGCYLQAMFGATTTHQATPETHQVKIRCWLYYESTSKSMYLDENDTFITSIYGKDTFEVLENLGSPAQITDPIFSTSTIIRLKVGIYRYGEACTATWTFADPRLIIYLS